MGVLQLFTADGKVQIDSVDANYEDSFTLETLQNLYGQHLAAHKALILARVKTRDKVDISRTFYSYYSAHLLNKTLFRRRGFQREIVSRYSPNNPLHVLNPLTNSEILGEVFYFVTSAAPPTRSAGPQEKIVVTGLPEGDPPGPDEGVAGADDVVMLNRISSDSEEGLEDSRGRRGGKGKQKRKDARAKPYSKSGSKPSLPISSPDGNFKAYFLGTDYHFVNDAVLRACFEEHALSASENVLLDDVRPGVPMAGDENDLDLMQIADRLANEGRSGPEELVVPYGRGLMFGAAAAAYTLVAILVCTFGINAIVKSTATDKLDSRWFWALLPFLSFLTDRLTAFIFQVQESRIAVLVKLLFWMAYVLVPVMFFPKNAYRYALARIVLDVLYPVVFFTYSCAFYLRLSYKKKLV